MKFCYIDESGTGAEPIAVMAGVITDATRMHITKHHWSGLLSRLTTYAGREIKEIHTRNFYSGNGIWKGLEGNQRSGIISLIFDWLKERKHRIVYVAVDKGRFNKEFSAEKVAGDIGTLWRFMALHITLSLQKHLQREKKNKGNIVLVFDNEEWERKIFTDLILKPPTWTDAYYDCRKEIERLDQIIDVPHFVDSKEVGLIQLADFICFFLRKHIELQSGLVKPDYEDEVKKVGDWAKQIFGQSIPKSCIYPQKGQCEAAGIFCKYAPECIIT